MSWCQSWRTAARSGPNPPSRSCTGFGANTGAAVHAQQELQASLRIGQVVDVQWRLGMAVSSDVCRSLNSPYVTLLLKIAEPSGLMCQKSFEMSIPQFQNFHKQFKEMAALMETV
ncbi:COMM domain-containing protein 6 [Oryzias melastigma]|uniref:COMM domain-containing protein 6 n=1 Tax=Oryzias melastigma TaxID=30732 RepID=A0A834F2C9_ORYME|nr:COMM domain-containing protein 6 [Oryzias melastigma]